MSSFGLKLRCQRCGAQMEMRDPAPDGAWKTDQFWVCPRCGRHFWTTYTTPPKPPESPDSGQKGPPEGALGANP